MYFYGDHHPTDNFNKNTVYHVNLISFLSINLKKTYYIIYTYIILIFSKI